MEFDWGRFLRQKDSSALQIVKYILCGGLSVVVDQVCLYLMAWLVFPCLRVTDPFFHLLNFLGLPAQGATEEELSRNYWIIKTICFLLSNGVVYVLNVLFVFRTGRYRRSVEILLFFATSLFQFFFIWLGGILITVWHWELTYSNITMLTVAIAVNFMIRKKVVFRG